MLCVAVSPSGRRACEVRQVLSPPASSADVTSSFAGSSQLFSSQETASIEGVFFTGGINFAKFRPSFRWSAGILVSHSGTPHAQHSDACTAFHVSAYACGAGVFSSTGSCRHPAWLCVAPPSCGRLLTFCHRAPLRYGGSLAGCRRTPLRWTVSLRGRVPLQSWVRQGSA